MSVLPSLDIMGRRYIGRVVEGSSGSPDLRTGMTSAILASVIGKLFFNILAVTLSGPGALFDSIKGSDNLSDIFFHHLRNSNRGHLSSCKQLFIRGCMDLSFKE